MSQARSPAASVPNEFGVEAPRAFGRCCELSVIIPTINEAQRLPLLLRQLKGQRGLELEVIVADGGSSDGTVELARGAGAKVCSGRAGRGAQMNVGAAQSLGDYLCFLHADSQLHDELMLARAVAMMRAVIRARGEERVAGHFGLRFERSEGQGDYGFLEEKTRLNRPGTTHGDQGLVLTRRFFEELGGFEESLGFLEDQKIAALVEARGVWLTLPGELWTSARRFEVEGFGARYVLMAMIMAAHHVGMEGFLAKTPGLYARQDLTREPLSLLPFVGALVAEFAKLERGERGEVASRLLVYLRQNAWQLCLWGDVRRREALGEGRYPMLRWFEQSIEPWL